VSVYEIATARRVGPRKDKMKCVEFVEFIESVGFIGITGKISVVPLQRHSGFP
jgi:hypothetical protein